MIYYLSGPMTGIKDYNYPAFEMAKNRLVNQGLEVRSPHEIDKIELSRNPNYKPGVNNYQWYLTRALLMQLGCDAWIGLPGWTRSRGSMREFEIAIDLDHELYLFWPRTPKTGSVGLEKIL